MPTLTKTPLTAKAEALRAAAADTAPILREIDTILVDVIQGMRMSFGGALRIGMRLLYLYRQTGEEETPGGYRAALGALNDRLPPSTAYRWMNAAAFAIAKLQGITNEAGVFDPSDLTLPSPTSKAWTALESQLIETTKGLSLRRLLIGSGAASEQARLDHIISATESGDPIADAIMEKIESGELTLVQAIRALGGASATKDKSRHDPVYLEIDGSKGGLTGLFPRCLITLKNTFNQWQSLDETARLEAKKAWKALVVELPKELR